MGEIKNIPEGIFLIHGEPSAMEGFDLKIRDTLGWKPHIPGLNEKITLWL